MIETPVETDVQRIVLDEVFPHTPEVLWRALTTGDLIGRWLMPPLGFEAVEGREFTFQTKPAGPWDGVIQCRILEVVPYKQFAFVWRGGHEDNLGYGSRLNTVVTFTLEAAPGGTRLRLVHTGFELPRNAFAFKNMSEGWPSRVALLATVAAGPH